MTCQTLVRRWLIASGAAATQSIINAIGLLFGIVLIGTIILITGDDKE